MSHLSHPLCDEKMECHQCGQWVHRRDLHLQYPYVLADHLHFPRSRGLHTLLSEAEQLLTRAVEALDASH